MGVKSQWVVLWTSTSRSDGQERNWKLDMGGNVQSQQSASCNLLGVTVLNLRVSLVLCHCVGGFDLNLPSRCGQSFQVVIGSTLRQVTGSDSSLVRLVIRLRSHIPQLQSLTLCPSICGLSPVFGLWLVVGLKVRSQSLSAAGPICEIAPGPNSFPTANPQPK
jgi:hypothetical protein